MGRNIYAARFRWLSALPQLLVIAALGVIAIGALAGESGGSVNRERFFDFLQRVNPAPSATASVFHVVAIDRESIDKIGPWPWPRTILADLAREAAEAGAKGVVIAEPVDAPDPLSPATIGDFWLAGARDEGLARQLAMLPNTDVALANALSRVDAAFAIAGAEHSEMQRADAKAADWLTMEPPGSGFLALPAVRTRFDVNEALMTAAQPAVAAFERDADGVVRRTAPLWSFAGKPIPSLGLQAARLAAGGAAISVRAGDSTVTSAGSVPVSISVGARAAALGPDASMRLYLPRQTTLASTPAWRVLDRGASNSQLRGQVVLIGLDAREGVAVSTARGPLSVASAQALAAQQLLSGVTLSRPGWAGYVEAVAVMLLGTAAIMWSQRLAFWRAVGVAAAASALLFLFSIGAFTAAQLLIDPLPASLALFLGALSVAGGRSLGVALRDDTVRGSFQGTLPEPTMKKIREEGAAEILDGDYRPLTVLACELRLTDEDLLRLSGIADDVTKLIAAACIDLRKAIIETGGAAEQAEGGKMFAYYNAPLENSDHVNAACAAALRLIESLDKTNAELEVSSRMRGVQIHLAVGIASGECFVGPMGHGRNNRYSAIGPAVDLAIFLRRQAEFYGPAIICDETVHRKTHHHFAFLELDRIKPTLTEKPMSIFALVGNPFIKSSKSYRALDDAHRQMLNAYRSGDWTGAAASLAKAKESPGAKIALFDIYEERIRRMSSLPAPPDWDGSLETVI